jgi:oxygen-independent coproporphyrinogen III oxidase
MSRWIAEPVRSLYIHVPFCAHKCEYCAFYSHAASGEMLNSYVAALNRELRLVANDLRPQTIFFGGGTPSLLSLRQWEQILREMGDLKLLGASEWTVECNPATVSLDKARLLRSFGVNRISMGVQSLDERLLERLGRVHTREMVFKSFDILRAAEFENINIDLMFAIPGQTMQIWRETLAEALALGSEHLSCYEIIYEEDTPLYAQLEAGECDVDEELGCDMFEELVSLAGERGFRQYEIANFARHFASSLSDIPDHACQHNVNYWRAGSFYGLGPSATSYVRGVRTKNWSNTTLYCEQLEKGFRAIESSEQLSPLARAGESAAFGVRMNAGWPFELFKEVTGFDLRQEWAADMEELVANDLGEISTECFRLTHRGLRLADSIGAQLLRSRQIG